MPSSSIEQYEDLSDAFMLDVEPAPLTRSFMMNDRFMLTDVALHRRQNQAYEELKRLILFAGIFFIFMITFVLLKFKISLDDIFKWSPVVWLVGVIVCGLMMNAFLHIRKFLKTQRAKRLRQQQNLLYSLNLPSSFSCLATSHMEAGCCQHSPHSIIREMQIIHSPEPLPSYNQAVITALRPHWTPPTASSSDEPLPPTYSITCLNETESDQISVDALDSQPDDTDSLLHRTPSEEDAPPAYDQLSQASAA